MNLLGQTGLQLPDVPEEDEIPQITKIEELQIKTLLINNYILTLECSIRSKTLRKFRFIL